jgi:hypothetical protein
MPQDLSYQQLHKRLHKCYAEHHGFIHLHPTLAVDS